MIGEAAGFGALGNATERPPPHGDRVAAQ